jgi:hypothetical protein
VLGFFGFHGPTQTCARQALHPAPPGRLGRFPGWRSWPPAKRRPAPDGHRHRRRHRRAAPDRRDGLLRARPALRAVSPDWETLPYDTFSPHQDLISERLATLWRIQQRDKDTGADVVLLPATTALYRLAPPAFLAGYTFHFKQKEKLDEARLKAS